MLNLLVKNFTNPRMNGSAPSIHSASSAGGGGRGTKAPRCGAR